MEKAFESAQSDLVICTVFVFREIKKKAIHNRFDN